MNNIFISVIFFESQWNEELKLDWSFLFDSRKNMFKLLLVSWATSTTTTTTIIPWKVCSNLFYSGKSYGLLIVWFEYVFEYANLEWGHQFNKFDSLLRSSCSGTAATSLLCCNNECVRVCLCMSVCVSVDTITVSPNTIN